MTSRDSSGSKSPLRKSKALESLRDAALDQSSVMSVRRRTTSPHGLYRYPARFSPQFAAAAIRLVTEPGDLVLDPFVGSGTTLYETMRHNRRCVGIDINPISTFLVGAMLQRRKQEELDKYYMWLRRTVSRLSVTLNGRELSKDFPVQNLDYRRNWRIVKLVDGLIASVDKLSGTFDATTRQILLRSCQWAFDNRKVTPSYREFLDFLYKTCEDVLITARAFDESIDEEWGSGRTKSSHRVFNGHADRVLGQLHRRSAEKYDAIITSPPYPGVHMLYGRWQVRGRRESELPLWIAGAEPYLREGDYTMHARRTSDNSSYFELLSQAMEGCRGVIRDGGWMVQMVGFSDPSTQLHRYLACVTDAGFKEEKSTRLSTGRDQRLWRTVPSRKWYANSPHKALPTRREVVLLFKAR